jgi:putative peptidoglycan lipid II flippase
MPHGALALANSIATFIEMSALLVAMRRRLSGLEGRRLLSGLTQALLAGGVMSLALWGWLTLTRGSSVWLVALGGVAAGSLVYGLMLVLLRVPEVKMLFESVKKRLIKQPS